MHPHVARHIPHIPEIRVLCREFGVERLEIFGSAVTDAFDPARSDMDFIVTFPDEYDVGPWLGQFFELERALAHVLQRDVDLISNKPSRNRFFAREVDRTRQDIYDASADAEVA